MIKILAIGDVHFKVNNIPEVELFIERIEKLARDLTPDVIVILGDVLDTHEKIHAIPLNKAVEFFDKMRKISYTVVLVGNHDSYNNQIFLNDNHWMNPFKEWNNLEIVDKVIDLKAGDKLLVFTPYVPPGRFIEALDTYKDWKKADCIFAHQEFRGCKMGAITSIDGDIWDETFPLVVSGHIHSKDKLQDNLYYTGSAMQHAFGESTKNVVVEVVLKDNGFDYNEIDLELPRKKVVSLSLKNVDEYEMKEDTRDKIMLSLKGNYDEFKTFKKSKKYKELTSKGVKIKFSCQKINIEKIDVEKEAKDTEFNDILYNTVISERDSYLTALYENIVLGKDTSPDDILYF